MMPLMGGRNRISISRSHSFASGQLEEGWLFAMENYPYNFQDIYGRGVTVDATGNVYSTGFRDDLSNSNCRVFKTTKDGVVVWQESLSIAGDNEQGRKLVLDSAGNVYVAIDGTSFSNLYVVKLNNLGVIQWEKYLSAPGGTLLNDITLDASNNVYIVGRNFNGPTACIFVAKYDTSGVLLWQLQIENPGQNSQGHGLIFDSAGDLLVTGWNDSSGYLYTAKLSAATGVIVWQKEIGDGVDVTRGYSVATNGTDVYVSGSAFITGVFNGLILKLDATGALIWQKKYGDPLSGFDMNARSVTVEPSGNVYMTVNKTVVPFGNILYIVKLSSAGALLWEREFSSPEGNLEAYDIFYRAGFLHVAGVAPNSLGVNTHFVAKLPDDGSGTGSYTLNGATINYQTSSLGLAATAYTSSVASYSESAATLTDNTSAFVLATTAFPNGLVNL